MPAASLACSLAPTLGWLIAARAVQGVGGSMLNPVAMSIITNVFTDPRERGRAIGAWGATVGISLALGPIVGGALTEAVDWRAIFWINVPIALAAVVLTALYVPESRAARPRRLDPVGQLLVIVVLSTVTYGIIDAPDAGWLSAQTLGLFVVSAVSLGSLVAYELRRREPLIEPRFFRSPPFTGATMIAVCAFAGFAGFLLINTLYLQEVRGYSPLQAGLCTLPMAILAGAAAPVSGRIVGSRGARPVLLFGGVCMLIAPLLLTSLSATTPLGLLLCVYALYGLGLRQPEPADHLHRRLGDAEQPGRCRGGRGIDEPPGRPDPRRGRDRLDRRHGRRRRGRTRAGRGEPSGLVGDRRLRRGRARDRRRLDGRTGSARGAPLGSRARSRRTGAAVRGLRGRPELGSEAWTSRLPAPGRCCSCATRCRAS